MHTELALVAVFTVLLFSYSLLSSRLGLQGRCEDILRGRPSGRRKDRRV